MLYLYYIADKEHRVFGYRYHPLDFRGLSILEACQERGVAAPTWAIYGGFVMVTFMRPTKNDTRSDTQDVTQDVTQDIIQDVPQGVPQGVPQDNELDDWIEKQIRKNPQISTEDLAKLSNRSSKTVERHLAQMPHIHYVGSGYSCHWKVLYSLLQTRLD